MTEGKEARSASEVVSRQNRPFDFERDRYVGRPEIQEVLDVSDVHLARLEKQPGWPPKTYVGHRAKYWSSDLRRWCEAHTG